MKRFLTGLLIGLLLFSITPAYAENWHKIPGTLATIDRIVDGYIVFEVVLPEGVTYIVLPKNLFDYTVQEGYQYMLQLTPYADQDRYNRLQDQLDRLQNRR